jgi:hypothetical protein
MQLQSLGFVIGLAVVQNLHRLLIGVITTHISSKMRFYDYIYIHKRLCEDFGAGQCAPDSSERSSWQEVYASLA